MLNIVCVCVCVWVLLYMYILFYLSKNIPSQNYILIWRSEHVTRCDTQNTIHHHCASFYVRFCIYSRYYIYIYRRVLFPRVLYIYNIHFNVSNGTVTYMRWLYKREDLLKGYLISNIYMCTINHLRHDDACDLKSNDFSEKMMKLITANK